MIKMTIFYHGIRIWNFLAKKNSITLILIKFVNHWLKDVDQGDL
jgi:hypothetical protein